MPWNNESHGNLLVWMSLHIITDSDHQLVRRELHELNKVCQTRTVVADFAPATICVG